MRLAVVNMKGGVGKSTTATSVAAGLAMAAAKRARPKGADGAGRVLLVDLDGQASTSVSVGIPRDQRAPGAPDLFIDERPVAECIRGTAVPGLDVICSDDRMYSADVRLASEYGRELRLRDGLAPVTESHPWQLLDCPPAFSVTMAAALVAADALIVPVAPEILAVHGLARLEETLAKMRRALKLEIPVLGYLLTMAAPRERATRELMEQLRARYGDLVFETVIRRSVSLKEAPAHGQTVYEYDPRGAGASDYAHLVVEISQRANVRLAAPVGAGAA